MYIFEDMTDMGIVQTSSIFAVQPTIIILFKCSGSKC